MVTVAVQKPSTEQVWTWLENVPDPEIPVLSVIDLGIIRHVAWSGGTLTVTVTPTYSGCPATAVIALDIRTELSARGIKNIEIKTQLSPPWTTDWLTREGRAKLQQYGIAPPNPAGGPVCCPQCNSPNTQKVSQFGSTPCKAMWRCTDCLEPFDYFKCI